MDGHGRALDNVFTEHLWRSVKYGEVYPRSYETVKDAAANIRNYFEFYNRERLHQALNYQTPEEIYCNMPLPGTGCHAGEIPVDLRSPSVSPA